MITIAVDAMGGDKGPKTNIAGAALAVRQYPDMRLVFYGLEHEVKPVLAQYSELAASVFHPCETATQMNEKPSQALRLGRGKSSMWHALEAVRTGEADACVSAGNTGALMAMSYFCLRMLAEAERPGIAGIWPTIDGEGLVLDIGATIGADASQLVDFAVMGAAMFRALYHVERPTVGLLNVGVEDVKGLEEIRKAGHILREVQSEVLDYKGFVEGNDIGFGKVDVVVTEGFVGNIALKTAEGTVRQAAFMLAAEIKKSLPAKIGYLLARGAFRRLREKVDPRRVNGGVLLGLNGLVIKSHGGTDAQGFASALRIGYEMAKYKLLEKISADLRYFHRSKPDFSLLQEKKE
ncbi:MAG: phosphate acyltransferase PlsX [Candidatus Tokpelaia sp.]|uniref:phosphate acyltransferase PlsX n=1 Tax=Candidatus Tokpelaia sp. TaxID=2233777 RepID=UPI00123C5A38|nr:phosphate acyltransferase PlsX [Candidatus Tokpelaia sp.]KAA6205856.1 MAG: phosphate acyltransferase PlsX [Candidatus Tokpelaia sp.]KAA6207706.1 MAG: phosphate acyltransferase PlsX [Candidatus Tokpelaia sp.]KAA6404880.1 phosphate acyltransferase PlsX [Candidatus Tokpelaia sp.]